MPVVWEGDDGSLQGRKNNGDDTECERHALEQKIHSTTTHLKFKRERRERERERREGERERRDERREREMLKIQDHVPRTKPARTPLRWTCLRRGQMSIEGTRALFHIVSAGTSLYTTAIPPAHSIKWDDRQN